MASTTPKRGFPYPEMNDQADGPGAFLALATKLDTDVQGRADAISAIANGSARETGWRNIATTNLNGGTAYWSGGVHLGRFGSQVRCTGFITLQAAATAFIGGAREGTGLINIPAGFRPIDQGYLIGVASSAVISGNSVQLQWLTTQGRLAVLGCPGNWSSGNSVGFSAVWDTNEAWPSSLPGVATT